MSTIADNTEDVKPSKPVKTNKTGKSLENAVEASVLELLGTPKNLFKITTRHLWDNRFRVTVYVTVQKSGEYGDLFDARSISDSHFIHATPEGGVLKSNPVIKKKYK